MDINEFLEILERKGFNIDYETLFEQNLGGEIDFADILKRIDKYEVARIQTEKSRLNLKAVENEKEIDDERIAAFNMKEAEILREFKTVIDVIEKETVLAVSVDYENSRKEIERYLDPKVLEVYDIITGVNNSNKEEELSQIKKRQEEIVQEIKRLNASNEENRRDKFIALINEDKDLNNKKEALDKQIEDEKRIGKEAKLPKTLIKYDSNFFKSFMEFSNNIYRLPIDDDIKKSIMKSLQRVLSNYSSLYSKEYETIKQMDPLVTRALTGQRKVLFDDNEKQERAILEELKKYGITRGKAVYAEEYTRDELIDKLRELNPGVEINYVDNHIEASIDRKKLKLPDMFYLDNLEITNKFNTFSGIYVSVEVRPPKIAENAPQDEVIAAMAAATADMATILAAATPESPVPVSPASPADTPNEPEPRTNAPENPNRHHVTAVEKMDEVFGNRRSTMSVIYLIAAIVGLTPLASISFLGAAGIGVVIALFRYTNGGDAMMSKIEGKIGKLIRKIKGNIRENGGPSTPEEQEIMQLNENNPTHQNTGNPRSL